MGEFKHSKGPWGVRRSPAIIENKPLIVSSSGDDTEPSVFKGHIVAIMDAPEIYKYTHNFSPEEQAANITLMAAAPEMLRVIRQTILRLEGSPDHDDLVQELKKVERLATFAKWYQP